jgi:hypothetical protein
MQGWVSVNAFAASLAEKSGLLLLLCNGGVSVAEQRPLLCNIIS